MTNLSYYENAIDSCYNAYKNNKNAFDHEGRTYSVSKKLIEIVYDYRIFPIMSCIGIGCSAIIKMNNIISLIIIRALCGFLTALGYKCLMIHLFAKELNRCAKTK